MLDLIKDSKAVIAVDSNSFVGVTDICAHYANLCEALSLDYEFVNDGTAILVNPKITDPELLIHNILETKDPGPHSFWDKTNSNPYEASISENKLFGLGVASSKLSLLQQIYAIKKLKDQGKAPKVILFGGSYSQVDEDIASDPFSKILTNVKDVLVSRPTSGRMLEGICGKAKVRFEIPLGEKESELKSRHFHQEDTATQTRIFRGITTHGASPSADTTTNALRKMLQYLEMLPQGVLILNMEAGHSTDQVPAEAVLELNLSQPVDDSVSNKLLALIKELDSLSEKFVKNRDQTNKRLPRLNIGKLRHSEKSLFLDVSFFMNSDFSKENLLVILNEIRDELTKYKLDFELRQFMEPLVFKTKNDLNGRLANILEAHLLPINKGESVIESAARKIHEAGANCLQFGIGVGLGNVDEPNEQIEIEILEKSVKVFEELMETYI